MFEGHEVWKYDLGANPIELEIPSGGKVLHFQNQGERLCIWVQVDPSKPKCKRRFEVIGTGYQMQNPEKLAHRGTLLLESGRLVVHLFERDL